MDSGRVGRYPKAGGWPARTTTGWTPGRGQPARPRLGKAGRKPWIQEFSQHHWGAPVGRRDVRADAESPRDPFLPPTASSQPPGAGVAGGKAALGTSHLPRIRVNLHQRLFCVVRWFREQAPRLLWVEFEQLKWNKRPASKKKKKNLAVFVNKVYGRMYIVCMQILYTNLYKRLEHRFGYI